MDALVRFVNKFDGSGTWADVETLFDRTFHPDVTVVTTRAVLDRQRWKATVHALVQRRARISDIEFKTSDGSDVSYRMAIAVDDGAPLDLSAIARLRDGLVVHVEPTDPTAYAELVRCVTAIPPIPITDWRTTMSTQKETVRRWVVDGFSTGDPALADEIIDPGFTYHHPGFPEMPTGPEGYRQTVALYRGACPDLTITLEDMVAEGDKVVARWTASGTNTGEMMGMPATGNAFEATGMNLFHMNGDKVAEAWTNFDDLGFMQQLGLVPTPG